MEASPTSPDLFGFAPPPAPMVERNTRGRKKERAAGYAFPPGTGDKGQTCGSCVHLAVIECSKRYHKCKRMESRWTASRRTDVLVRSPACYGWEGRKKED